MLTISEQDDIHRDMKRFDTSRAIELLAALGEQLEAGGRTFELVVIGGTALQVLGLVDRTTRDVDVLAFRNGNELTPAEPFPEALTAAVRRVARDLRVGEEWLNAGPSDLVRLGLPEGFVGRLETRSFGPRLSVHFAGRYDQIHFKLYAMVDQRSARHEADLRALEPSPLELVAAARWARTHDPSEPFDQELGAVLRYLGAADADPGT